MDIKMIRTLTIKNYKYMKRNCTLLMVIASLMGMISCNVIEPDNPNGEKEIIMLLNGEVNGYDNVLTKASNDRQLERGRYALPYLQ